VVGAHYYASSAFDTAFVKHSKTLELRVPYIVVDRTRESAGFVPALLTFGLVNMKMIFGMYIIAIYIEALINLP
jgi:hypothetical protein